MQPAFALSPHRCLILPRSNWAALKREARIVSLAPRLPTSRRNQLSAAASVAAYWPGVIGNLGISGHGVARIQYKRAIGARQWMQYLTLRIALQRCGTHSHRRRPEARTQYLARLLAKDCHRRQRFPPSSLLCKFFYPRRMIFDFNDTDSGANAPDQRDLELIIRVWDELSANDCAYLMPIVSTIVPRSGRSSAFERPPGPC